MKPTTPPTKFSWRTSARGFTLMEMMVVVAIIGILALMAIPNMQDTFVRNQIAEALPLLDIAKPPVQAQWTLTKTLPADNAAAGLPSADKIVSNLISNVMIQDGAIHATFGNRANALLKGKVITLRPGVIEDAPIVPIAWVCAAAAAPEKMTVKGEDKTTVPAKYLTAKCR